MEEIRIGKRIKEIRKNLTQKEFANKIGVDKTTIASWEINRREPDLTALVQITDIGGVSLDWLAGRYETTLSQAQAYHLPAWRELIDLAHENGISPELLKQLLEAAIRIKKA